MSERLSLQVHGLRSRNEFLWTTRWEGRLFDASRAEVLLRVRRGCGRCRLSNLRGRFCLGRHRLGRCRLCGGGLRVRGRNCWRSGQNRGNGAECGSHRFEHLLNRSSDDVDGGGDNVNGFIQPADDGVSDGRKGLLRQDGGQPRVLHRSVEVLHGDIQILDHGLDFQNYIEISRSRLGRRCRSRGQARSGMPDHGVDGSSCRVGQFCGRGPNRLNRRLDSR